MPQLSDIKSLCRVRWVESTGVEFFSPGLRFPLAIAQAAEDLFPDAEESVDAHQHS